MRRLGWIVVALGLALGLGILALLPPAQGRAGGASYGTPSTASSPLVGAWVVTLNPAQPRQPPAVVIFTSDGLVHQSNADGTDGAGSWQATGARTAILTLVFPQTDAHGAFRGTRIVRAAVTVSADGRRFTSDNTQEFVDASGHSTGQLGPGHAAGTRIVPSAPGTPVGTPAG